MMRIVNFHRLGASMLPVHMRQPRMLATVKALVSPLYVVQRLFLAYRDEVIYKINHNGQVCYLRGVLNDSFDMTERRIQVVDNIKNDFLLLYRREEMKEVNLGQRLLSRRDSVMADQLDFIIKVPGTLNSVDQEARLKSVVNFYKLAGKRYRIDYE